MFLGWAPRTALCLSSAKVYMGVKQEIAEMRIPALNAYMKVTAGPCQPGTWEGKGCCRGMTWGQPRYHLWAWLWELGLAPEAGEGRHRSNGRGTRSHAWS